MSTNILEEHFASIIKAEEQVKTETNKKQENIPFSLFYVAFSLHFNPED
jgi:hypothetical protein